MPGTGLGFSHPTEGWARHHRTGRWALAAKLSPAYMMQVHNTARDRGLSQVTEADLGQNGNWGSMTSPSQVSLVKALDLCRSTLSPVLMRSWLITRAFLKANIPAFSRVPGAIQGFYMTPSPMARTLPLATEEPPQALTGTPPAWISD